MLLDFTRLVLWLLLCVIVAVIEYTTGLPIVTVTLIMLAVLSLPTIWTIVFVSLITMVLAALFSESWLLIWSLVMGGVLMFRVTGIKSKQTFITRISLVVLVALLLSAIREPVLTPLFLIHSCISLIISGYLLWQRMKPKNKNIDITELRFTAER